jgi:hypothetical protein
MSFTPPTKLTTMANIEQENSSWRGGVLQVETAKTWALSIHA